MQTIQTGGQLYADAPPYKVTEYSPTRVQYPGSV